MISVTRPSGCYGQLANGTRRARAHGTYSERHRTLVRCAAVCAHRRARLQGLAARTAVPEGRSGHGVIVAWLFVTTTARPRTLWRLLLIPRTAVPAIEFWHLPTAPQSPLTSVPTRRLFLALVILAWSGSTPERIASRFILLRLSKRVTRPHGARHSTHGTRQQIPTGSINDDLSGATRPRPKPGLALMHPIDGCRTSVTRWPPG